MDIVLIILGGILSLIGIVGSVLPILPGPFFSYMAFVLLQLTSKDPFNWNFFIIWAVVVGVIIVLDYVVPSRGTKKFGGTKRGIRGSNIGLIISVILLPLLGITIGPFGLLGLIAGPFIGAYIGESFAGKTPDKAMKAAIGSFIGFLTGSLLKIVVTIIMALNFFINVYVHFIK